MALDPVTTILDIGGKLIDKLFPDPAKKQEAALKLVELQQSGELAVIANQVEINKIEAASRSTFVAGWRPFVGWVCASALAAFAVLLPIASIFVKFAMPTMPTDLLTTLLIGMLGLGGMRTVEKLQGVAK